VEPKFEDRVGDVELFHLRVDKVTFYECLIGSDQFAYGRFFRALADRCSLWRCVEENGAKVKRKSRFHKLVFHKLVNFHVFNFPSPNGNYSAITSTSR